MRAIQQIAYITVHTSIVVVKSDIELSTKEEMQGEGGETEAVLTTEARTYQAALNEFQEAQASVAQARKELNKWKEENQGISPTDPILLQLKKDVKEAQEGLDIAIRALAVAKQGARDAAVDMSPKKQKLEASDEWMNALQERVTNEVLNNAKRQQQEAEPKPLPISKDPFFSQVNEAQVDNDMLKFRYPIPLTKRTQLYIRSAYKKIYELGVTRQDATRRKYVTVTGTPGIGKSAFLYYVFWRMVKEKKRVFFVTSSIYFDGESMHDLIEIPPIRTPFWTPSLWCLIDSADPISRLGQINVDNCSILLATSPREDYLRGFKKLVPTPHLFYMPLWSRDELQSIARLYTNAGWEKRFIALGGIPRYVLEDVSREPEELLRAACTECSLDDAVNVVSVDAMVTNKTKVVQSLVHVQSEDPFTRAEVRYASPTAVNIIVQTYSRKCSQQVKTLLASSEETSLAGTLRGHMFEHYAIKQLHKGGRFVCRELFAGRPTKKRNATIYVPPSQGPVKVVSMVARDQETNHLYVPKTKNFASIDAWMPGFGAFQITVAKTHGLKDGVINDIAKLGARGSKLFWVLPPRHFDSFTKKQPEKFNFAQHAIRIPYPDVIDESTFDYTTVVEQDVDMPGAG